VLSRAENEELTRVGAGTPMGELMRRFWLPALLGEELEPGGAPKRVRLLGERLVAFRGDDGGVGVLDESCPHRGASLALALNERCALRCLYHGWQIDAEGRVLDTPAEPEDSTFKERVRARAYPCREAGGLIWTYLGDDAPPQFPAFDWTSLPDENLLVLKARGECNWAQLLEGAIDSAHQTYLHVSRSRNARNAEELQETLVRGDKPTEGYIDAASGQFVRSWTDGRPRLETEDTPWGFRYAAIRKPAADAERTRVVRVTHFVAPVHTLIPAPAGMNNVLMFVPMDDETTMFYQVRARYHEPIGEAERAAQRRDTGLEPGVDIDADYRKVRRADNNWLQDRDEMRSGDRQSGIHGVVVEDHAVCESMGPVFDRTREHVATSDVAVIRFRRIMLAAARALQEGEPALGLDLTVPYEHLRGEERTLPLDTHWTVVGALPDAVVGSARP
jgi:phthalate 4,5-dioxygenase oxygenase subunit